MSAFDVSAVSVPRAPEALDSLSVACFAALGPASYWGDMAIGNAGAVRRMLEDPAELARDRAYGAGGWLTNRALDWRKFATETDPDLAALASAAADALDALVCARE